MSTSDLVGLLRAAADSLERGEAAARTARVAARAAAIREECGPLERCPWGERGAWRRRAVLRAERLGLSTRETAEALGLDASTVRHAKADVRRGGV